MFRVAFVPMFGILKTALIILLLVIRSIKGERPQAEVFEEVLVV